MMPCSVPSRVSDFVRTESLASYSLPSVPGVGETGVLDPRSDRFGSWDRSGIPRAEGRLAQRQGGPIRERDPLEASSKVLARARGEPESRGAGRDDVNRSLAAAKAVPLTS